MFLENLFIGIATLDTKFNELATKAFVAKEEIINEIFYPESEECSSAKCEKNNSDVEEKKSTEKNILLSEIAFNDKETIMNLSIDELEFSVRTYNCLKRAGIENVGDLLKSKLGQIKYLEDKGVEEIVNKLKELASKTKQIIKESGLAPKENVTDEREVGVELNKDDNEKIQAKDLEGKIYNSQVGSLW